MTETSEVKPVEAKIPSALACPEGDIFSLPSKEDIVNAFNEIAAIPGQLQAKVQEMKAEREKEIAELYKKLEEAETEEERLAILKQIEEKENYIKTQIEGVIQGQIDDVIKTIEEFVDTLADILSPYWDKDGLNRDWQKEAREAFKELLEEFHTYIPTKIAEIISKIVPITFTVNIMGISIDIIKLITSPAYKKELIDQISGKQFDLQIVEKFKEIQKINDDIDKLTKELADPDISIEDHIKKTEELEALEKKKAELLVSIDDIYKLKNDFVDKLFQLVPEEYRNFDGEFGVVDNKGKAKIIWNYIKTQVKKYMQNSLVSVFEKLIGIFDKIWDLLGLPDLPFSELIKIMTFDIKALIDGAIKALKEQWEKLKDSLQTDIGKLNRRIKKLKKELADPDISMEDHIKKTEELEKLIQEKKDLENKLLEEQGKFFDLIKDKILGLELFGFSIKSILGDIKSTTASIEEEISEMLLALEDFRLNWHKKILFDWVKIIKKFLSAIGLGSLFEFVFLTWCDFLKLIGMPFSINLKIPAIAGIITAVVTETKKDTRPSSDDTSDEGIAYTKVKDEEQIGDKVFSVTTGTGTLHAFVDGIEIEHGSGVTISGGTATFDVAPLTLDNFNNGISKDVSLIRINA
tara:strand:+ start:7226 stop:9130 length:1905 start_codon:yes stop_codon:yes gene_type:complete